MRPGRRYHCSRRALALLMVAVGFLAGCNDLPRQSQSARRALSGDGPPKAAPALAISNPPLPPRSDVTPAVYTTAPRELPEALVPQIGQANTQSFEHPLRALYQRAMVRQATMDAYTFRLKRREVVGKAKQPEEVQQVKLRREPFSVHLQAVSGDSKGREVIYVQGKYGNKMQVLLAPNDPFGLLGRRHSVAPDALTVREKSRHLITETGFTSLIERYGRLVTAIEKGDMRVGTAKYLGLLKRPEFLMQVEAVHQALPPGAEPQLPRGGQRWWYFDASHNLPVLVITHDPDGEVEYYCYDDIQWPVPLGDDDFNPDRLWRR